MRSTVSLLVSFGLLAALGAGCVTPSPAADAEGATRFGAAVPEGEPIPLAALKAEHPRYAGQTVLTEGRVDKVCQKKGCWLSLAADDGKVRVVFKNYGFFVPASLHGQTVRLHGVLERKEVSEAEARHYLSDEGASAEELAAVVGPQQAWHFVAAGVETL